jgi:hypothetical protein
VLTVATAPARSVVEYRDERFQGAFLDENRYKGPPQPELDAAWHALINGMMLPTTRCLLTNRRLGVQSQCDGDEDASEATDPGELERCSWRRLCIILGSFPSGKVASLFSRR